MTRSGARIRVAIEIAAALGVIVSLLFVGLELRQNTAAVRGATFQALSDASADDLSAVAQDPELAALLEQVYFADAAADTFESSENVRLWFYYAAFIRRLENSYLQYTSGIVDERVFQSYGWKDALLERRHFWDFWDDMGGNASVDPGFRTFFEDRVDRPG